MPPSFDHRLLPLAAVLATASLLLTACPSPSCSTNGDCQSTEACLSGTCGPKDGGVALADGGFAVLSCDGNPNLLVGTQVGPATDPGTCILPRQSSALPAQRIVPLGSHPVGSSLSFNLPAQTFGFSIVAQAVHAPGPVNFNGTAIENTVYADFLTAPGSNSYFSSNDGSTNEGVDRKVFYPFAPAAPVTSAMTLPNTTAALVDTATNHGLPSGGWTFLLADIAYVCSFTNGCTGGSDAGVYDVTLLTRPGVPAARGNVDLDVYLVTANSNLTRLNATNDAHIERMMQTLANLYRSSGACVGKVTFFDVPDWARTRFATPDVDQEGPCSDLSQMYTLSAPNRQGIPVFLVEALTTSGNQTVLGKDGTIPGPATISGTVFSGVVASAADLAQGTCSSSSVNYVNCGADRVAYIAAHEVGHFLGLFHTTESTGTIFDPLTDTAHCNCQSCVPPARKPLCADQSPAPTTPTSVAPADCSSSDCAGADNLMFWSFDANRAVGNLSGQQGSIARANPAVH